MNTMAIFRLQSFYKKYNVDTMGVRKFVVLVGGGSYNPLTRYDDAYDITYTIYHPYYLFSYAYWHNGIHPDSDDEDEDDDDTCDGDSDDDDDDHSDDNVYLLWLYRMHLRTYFLAKQYLGNNIIYYSVVNTV